MCQNVSNEVLSAWFKIQAKIQIRSGVCVQGERGLKQRTKRHWTYHEHRSVTKGNVYFATVHTNTCKRLQGRIQLGENLYMFLDFIKRKYFILILKMKLKKTILINCTGKCCYQHRYFQNYLKLSGEKLF